MKKSIIYALVGTLVIFFGACDSCSKKQKETKKEVVAHEPQRISEPVKEVFVTEDWVHAVPVVVVATPAKTTTPAKTATPAKTDNKHDVSAHNAYTRVTTKDLDHNLSQSNIKQTKKVDTSFFCFHSEALNTTKTVTSYNKKGKEVMKVVSDPKNPDVIDYIVFTDKNNDTDVYGVNVGLTGKEARRLRREMKHFERKGKVFLYHEDSNILYQMDGVTSEGKRVTDSEIDDMQVSAIVWKDRADKPHVHLKERKNK